MISKIATRNQNSHQRRLGTLLLILMARQLPPGGQCMPAILATLATVAPVAPVAPVVLVVGRLGNALPSG